MQTLVDKIRADARHIGNGIIKVDSFINHQIIPGLTAEMGKAFAREFHVFGVRNVTKVLTAEVSGIASALATAQVLDVPLLFARKRKPVTMAEGCYESAAVSPTKGDSVVLRVSKEYLSARDTVVIIDDFLASARTVQALADIIKQSGARLAGIGCVIEKIYSKGRAKLSHLGVPVITLAKIDLIDGQLKAF